MKHNHLIIDYDTLKKKPTGKGIGMVSTQQLENTKKIKTLVCKD